MRYFVKEFRENLHKEPADEYNVSATTQAELPVKVNKALHKDCCCWEAATENGVVIAWKACDGKSK